MARILTATFPAGPIEPTTDLTTTRKANRTYGAAWIILAAYRGEPAKIVDQGWSRTEHLAAQAAQAALRRNTGRCVRLADLPPGTITEGYPGSPSTYAFRRFATTRAIVTGHVQVRLTGRDLTWEEAQADRDQQYDDERPRASFTPRMEE